MYELLLVVEGADPLKREDLVGRLCGELSLYPEVTDASPWASNNGPTDKTQVSVMFDADDPFEFRRLISARGYQVTSLVQHRGGTSTNLPLEKKGERAYLRRIAAE